MYQRLSKAVRRRVEALKKPRIDVDDIREVVDGHLRQARESAVAGQPVDVELAIRLHASCVALLEVPSWNERDYGLVQACCLYFADDEDDEGDFTSSIGLQDDVEVLNHVVVSLGRPELAIR